MVKIVSKILGKREHGELGVDDRIILEFLPEQRCGCGPNRP
jgi:hypothetical protein